jgi:hypothetical protein
MRRNFTAFCLFLGLQVCFLSITAQVINIESKRMEAANEGWAGQGEFAYAFIKNQNTFSQMSTRLNFIYNKNQNTYIILTDLSFIQSSAGDFENAGFQHVRYNYAKTNKLTFEAYSQVQFSKQMHLYPRYAIGAGPRYKIFKNDSVRVYAGASLLLEHEQLQEPYAIMSNERLTGYFSCIINKIPNVSVDFMMMFQPRLFDLNDMRFQGEMRLDFPVSNQLKFRFATSIYNDSKPPAGVPNNFTQARNSIIYNF